MKLLAIIILLGAAIGLAVGFAFVVSHQAGYALSPGAWFLKWIENGQFWPWPLLGAIIAGWSYAATWLIRKSN
jgi:hypothetical protein